MPLPLDAGGGLSVHSCIHLYIRRFLGNLPENAWSIPYNSACWCILTTFRTGQIMVMVYWFPPLALLYFRETGEIFGVSGHFPENGNEGNGLKCCMLLYTDQLKTNFRLWLRSVDFPHFAGFPAFSWERMEGMPSFWHADVSQPPSELIWFWSCSRFFPILVPTWLRETGHIWGFPVLSGERIGVNINGGVHISGVLHRVLCSFNMVC